MNKTLGEEGRLIRITADLIKLFAGSMVPSNPNHSMIYFRFVYNFYCVKLIRIWRRGLRKNFVVVCSFELSGHWKLQQPYSTTLEVEMCHWIDMLELSKNRISYHGHLSRN